MFKMMLDSEKHYNKEEQWHAQEQPPEEFCRKRYSEKFLKIHRETPVSDSIF